MVEKVFGFYLEIVGTIFISNEYQNWFMQSYKKYKKMDIVIKRKIVRLNWPRLFGIKE